MAYRPIISAVCVELRTLSRGSLLIIAERAAELIPADQLAALLGDLVHPDASASGQLRSPPGLVDDARSFFDAAMAGNYYEAVEINNRGRQEQSAGTDAFVAEFDRLVRRCVHAADHGDFVAVRDSIELLLDLLRHVDEGNDDVLFFADDGGSRNVGVNWRFVLPAYFKCLAADLSPTEFAHIVVSTIEEFVRCNHPHYLAVALTVANDEQRRALEALATL